MGGDRIFVGGSLLDNGPIGSIILFTLPVVLDSLLRCSCGFISGVVINRCINARTLTTINGVNTVGDFVVNATLKLADNFAVPITRGFKTNRCHGVGGCTNGDVALSLIVNISVIIITRVVSGPVLHLVGAPSSVFGLSTSCVGVLCFNIPVRVLFGGFANVTHSLNSDGEPLCFLVLDILIGLTLSVLLINGLKLNIHNTTTTAIVSCFTTYIFTNIFILGGRGRLGVGGSSLIPGGGVFTRRVGLNVPISLRFAVASVNSVVLRATVGNFNSSTVTTLATTNEIRRIVGVPVDKLNMTGTAFISRGCNTNGCREVVGSIGGVLVLSLLVSIFYDTILVFTKPCTIH